MKNLIPKAMLRATALTRAGNLQEATALIQSLLTPGQGAPEADDTVEGTFTRLDDRTPPRPAKARKGADRPRSRLSETLRSLAAGGMPARGPLATAPVAVPPGAQFLSLTHRSAHGSRDYRLYVPAGHHTAPLPLVVMLHGCTQTPEDFATGTGMNALAEEFGCLVAYPAQPAGANAQKCWNWFRPDDQDRGAGEPALIAGIVADVLRGHAADPARVYVTGLSAGGAAAAIMGAAYPEVFAAVGVHSGLPAGSARDVPSAFAAMRGGAAGSRGGAGVPTIVFHGRADTTVHPANGGAVMAQALHGQTGLQVWVEEGATAGGRSFRRTSHAGAEGPTLAEHWEIDGAGHAWAGGQPGGSYTDPAGPDASRQMLRFFLQHVRGLRAGKAA